MNALTALCRFGLRLRPVDTIALIVALLSLAREIILPMMAEKPEPTTTVVIQNDGDVYVFNGEIDSVTFAPKVSEES